MKKINFLQHIVPHALAVVVFLIVTVIFFSPVFFENKTLNQHDIVQSIGAAKALRDFRSQTGEEGLWVPNMFSGMPAYLVNVQWSNQPVTFLKSVLSLGLPHPVNNIFIAFLSYYILLLCFRVRPYMAIAGALAFGLSSYMIIGLMAGHNARIGAIAFMPLVVGGIHLAFNQKKILGFGLTTAGLALHLRENHLQITYYLLLIVLAYGLVQLIYAIREKQLREFFKPITLLIPAAVLATGSFFGPLWGISEYSRYSIRGKSELVSSATETPTDGLKKDYAFEYSNGILEPMVLMLPNFYGGSSSDFLVQNPDSKVYQALVNSGDQNITNQLAPFSRAYWGPQSNTAPYYGGAIIFFLFIVGIVFADKKFVWWLLPLSVLAVVLSWGSNFSSFNYLVFDYFPGYNKFRSVTFALLIILFAMPLLGMLGLEKLFDQGLDKENKKKLLVAFAASGGLCLLILIISGMFSFMREGEADLPAWFTDALRADRRSLMRADALRSFSFIAAAFIFLYFNLYKKATAGFIAALIFFIAIDLIVVDRRYFTKDNYQSKRKNKIEMSPADQQVLNDKDYYRVLNLSGLMADALTSYYHNSVGGYHGAKLKRYQDLYDSAIYFEIDRLIQSAQEGDPDFENLPVINMLNTRYIFYGQNRANVLRNRYANGSAWFVKKLSVVQSADEEISAVAEIDSKTQAVINGTEFSVQSSTFDLDSTASILLVTHKPNYMKYESNNTANGLAVFSEIYYPKGWVATIDGTETPIMRANYVLRALSIPAGKHTIEFRFNPKPYAVGNKITLASSWLVLLVFLSSVAWHVKNGL
ncbi:YfhO family protein [Oscillatoria amoena NRMC-F 0135]|nr:YfhO family protein [Oscillatoria amoena NRMC-F 0135]